MMRSRALFLLLAVAASQVHFSLTYSTPLEPDDMGVYRFDTCAIRYYGRTYDMLHVSEDDTTITLCFDNVTEPALDCLVVGNPPALGNMSAEVVSGSSGFPVSSILPKINSTESCSVVFRFSNYSEDFSLALLNFDTQSVLRTDGTAFPGADYTVKSVVGNSTVGSWRIGVNRTYVDLSGCRHEGDLLLPGQGPIRVACSETYCTDTAVIDVQKNCPFVCAVTGSTVVRFYDRTTSISDRCTYGLLQPEAGNDFSIFADFKERRRRDVPFLDSLTLRLRTGSELELLQGGRVQLDGRDVMLDSSAQMVEGLELSKDETGVTARIPSHNITVSFDGYTALLSGPDQALRGMCQQPFDTVPTVPIRQRTGSCKTKYNDTEDSSVNCTLVTERCELMFQPPFTDCHDQVKPAPYVEACKRTLCKYPEVDGLRCQFFKAYTEACSIRGTLVEDWRSTVDCYDAPQTFCQNRSCSEHEFCGEIPGSHRCFCRALFASKYRADDSFGEPTLCRSNSATLTMANCLLEDKGVDFTNLHLNDKTCTGDMDPESHMVTFRFDEHNTCGAEVMMNNSQVIYKNTIMNRNTSGQVIVRQDQVLIDFSCYYPKPDLKTVAFRIKDSSVIQQIVSGVWNYTLIMEAFTDPRHNNLILPTTEIQLNQKIWVELRTQGLDANLVAVVTDSCWATSAPEATSSPKYDLIISRCANPADGTVNVKGNGLATFNSFSFNMFQFNGKTGDVYLHCKLELCLKGKKSCATNCGGGSRRRRRSLGSKQSDENSALITMSWSD